MGKEPAPLVLKEIQSGAESVLTFVFDEAGQRKVWQFAPASAAEFLALLTAGRLRSPSTVELKVQSFELRPLANGEAVVCAGIGSTELCFEVSRADLENLRDDIEAFMGSRPDEAHRN